jgi:acetoin utilization protein AcuB
MLVKERMIRDPVTVREADTLARALELTREHRIRHLPAVDDAGRVVGVVSDRDIRLAAPSSLEAPEGERSAFLEGKTIAQVMSSDLVTITPRQTLEEAAGLFYRHRINCLPVVDPEGRLEGLLTSTDVLRAFTEILGVMEPSSRLELEVEHRPGRLAEAVRIIGEEHALNIVSLLVPPNPGASVSRVVVRIATIDPREVVASLRHAGFAVGWPSLDEDLSMGDAGAMA